MPKTGLDSACAAIDARPALINRPNSFFCMNGLLVGGDTTTPSGAVREIFLSDNRARSPKDHSDAF